MNAADVILSDDDLDALSEAGAVIVCTSDSCNDYSPTYSPSTPCSTLRVITDIVARHRAEVGARFAEWASKNEIADPPLDWAWYGEIVRWTGATEVSA